MSSLYWIYLIVYSISTITGERDRGYDQPERFFLVRRGWGFDSSCAKVKTLWNLNLKDCLKSACEIGNVVLYKEYLHGGQYSCAVHKCELNQDGAGWDFGWQRGWELYRETKAYAVPPTFPPICENPYFIRRTFETGNMVYSNCQNLRGTINTGSLRICMAMACDRKANVLNFVQDKRACILMHCSWNSTTEDYNFHFTGTTEKVVTYILSPVISTCEVKQTKTTVAIPTSVTISETTLSTTVTIGTTTNTEPKSSTEIMTTKDHRNATILDQRNSKPKNIDFKIIAIVMSVLTGVLLSLVVVTVSYVFISRLKRRKKSPRETSISSLSSWEFSEESSSNRDSADDSPYDLIDETKMIELH